MKTSAVHCLFRVVKGGKIQHIDGVEVRAFQTVPHRHKVRHILNIDVGSVVRQVLFQFLVQIGLLPIVIAGLSLRVQRVVGQGAAGCSTMPCAVSMWG